MQIKYKNKKVENQCKNISQAKRAFNINVAEKLMSSINYIESAKNFHDIANHLPFHLHKLVGDRKNIFAIDLGRKLGYRLLIEPMDENENTIKNEKDINKIYECTKIILVVEVTNHYD